MSFDPLAFIQVKSQHYSAIMAEISRLTDEGLSGRAILSDFRERGIQLRDSVFFSLRRDALGLKKFQEQLSSLTDDRIVPRSWHYNPENWQLSRRNLYTFQIDLQNIKTGEIVTDQFGGIATDEMLTVGAMKDMKRQQIESQTEETKWRVIRIDLFQAISR